MTAIQTVGLTKCFRDKTAVSSLNLEIEQGELFALLGVNGAGKTTAIKMLSCLSKPTGGDAFLLGDSITANPQAVKQKIGVAPQETAVAPNLTVWENLELIARIYGASRSTARRKAEELLASFRLEDAAKRRAKTLSGGTQRRLSIALALISEPQILFLDEPSLGLDVLARRELWAMIEALKGRITIILTTHYMEEAQALSDRIGILSHGVLRMVGTAGELMKRTGASSLEDAFVAVTTEREGA